MVRTERTYHPGLNRGKGRCKMCSANHVDIREACFSEGYVKSTHCHTHQSVLQVTVEHMHGGFFAELFTSLEAFNMTLNIVPRGIVLPVGSD